jgi:hypothetical protein
VWSAFMKVALRGKTPTDLPTAPEIASGDSGAPIPPAAITAGRGREPVRPAQGTIDGWFLDRLFSRR